MKKVLCWVGILVLSVSLWIGLIHPAQPQTRSLMLLYCRPEGGFLRLNMVPESTGGITWQGYGTLEDTVINISGRSSFRWEDESLLSLPSNPPPTAAITVTARSLEASARGQVRELGRVALKDIRVQINEEGPLSGKSTALLLVDNPVTPPQLPFANGIQNCTVANLSTLRRHLNPPTQISYGCYCSNPNLPRELSAELSSGPVFTEWRDRTRESCRVSARVEGTFTCNRIESRS